MLACKKTLWRKVSQIWVRQLSAVKKLSLHVDIIRPTMGCLQITESMFSQGEETDLYFIWIHQVLMSNTTSGHSNRSMHRPGTQTTTESSPGQHPTHGPVLAHSQGGLNRGERINSQKKSHKTQKQHKGVWICRETTKHVAATPELLEHPSTPSLTADASTALKYIHTCIYTTCTGAWSEVCPGPLTADVYIHICAVTKAPPPFSLNPGCLACFAARCSRAVQTWLKMTSFFLFAVASVCRCNQVNRLRAFSGK